MESSTGRFRASGSRPRTPSPCSRRATCSPSAPRPTQVRNRQNDPSVATYIVDRNINYTNVCVYRCQFCAFYRPSSEHPEAYVLSHEQIGEKIQETIDLGGTGVLLQGGVHAELPFSFYEDMFRYIRTTFPTIHLHALSAPEVYFLQKITKWPMRDVIARLQDAGLQSIPGGGAEILEDSVRKRIWSLTKAPTEKWVDVHESAHGLGMRTTATMMFGVGETYAQRRRAPAGRPGPPGPDGRLHRLDPVDVPEGEHRARRQGRRGRRIRVPEDARGLAALPRQHPPRPGLVGHAGPEDRPGLALVRRRRSRLDHDRGERRLRRGRPQPDDAGRDAPDHLRRGLHARAAPHALRRLPGRLLPRPDPEAEGSGAACRFSAPTSTPASPRHRSAEPHHRFAARGISASAAEDASRRGSRSEGGIRRAVEPASGRAARRCGRRPQIPSGGRRSSSTARTPRRPFRRGASSARGVSTRRARSPCNAHGRTGTSPPSCGRRPCRRKPGSPRRSCSSSGR